MAGRVVLGKGKYKMAKMKENSKAYDKEAINLALSRVKIMRCKTCGHPTLDGYICSFCGEVSPIYYGQEESMIEV